MAQDTYMTIAGNLTASPKSGVGSNGASWARVRVASTPRRFDREEAAWRDGDTVFLDVMSYRRLADNVVATLQRGDRVLVSGRVRQRSYTDEQGVRRSVTEIEADAIGPDLGRHPAQLVRPPAADNPTEVGGDEAAPEPEDSAATDRNAEAAVA